MYIWLGAFGIVFLCLAISELFKHLIGPKEEKKEEIKDRAEPKFGTTLTTPIEDIIEETISEELAEDITTKKKSQTKKGSVKPVAKNLGKVSEKTRKKPKEPIDGDVVGYSVFNTKTVGKIRIGDSSSNVLKKVDYTEAPPVDDIGFSFLPVKTKGKKYKNTHEKKDTKPETLNTVVEKTIRKTKEDHSKPSIIDHYKPNQKHQAVIETVPVATKKFTRNLEKVQQFVNEHKLEEKRSSENLIKEYKESKKVSSGVSYASIAKNSVDTHEKFEGSIEPDVKYQEPVTELALSGLHVYIEPGKSVCSQEQSQITFETSILENQLDLIIESTDKLFECNSIQNDLLIDEITNTQEDIRSKNSSICVVENFDSDDEQGLILSNLNEFVSIEQKLISLKEEPTKESSRSKNSSICVIGSLSDTDDLDDEATLLSDSAQKFIKIETAAGNTLYQPSVYINDIEKTVENTKVEITNGITEEYNSEPVPKVDLGSSVANSIETGESFSLEYTQIEENESINSTNFKASKLYSELGEISENSTQYIPISSEEVNQIKIDIKGEVEPQIQVDNFQPVINSETGRKIVIDSHFEVDFSHPVISSVETVEKVDIGDLLAEVESQIETNFTENRCELSHQDNSLSDLASVIQDYEPFVPKPVDSLTKQAIQTTKNFIEEEICIKKFAYTTSREVGTKPDIHFSTKLLYTTMQPVRVLTLNAKQHQDCTLYRIEKNWVVQFRIGPSLFGRKLYLYCNYPVEQNDVLTEFKRSKYQLLEWICDEGCQNADDTAFFAQITTSLAGSFHFYFTYENDYNSERQGSGYFLVDPVLKYGNDEILALDCIQCQTVLAKNLGSFSTWEDKLRVGKESGYNMIHFTPIQQLGESNSCYSLSEQLKLNPQFRKNDGNMPTFEELEKLTTKLRKEWKVASICDIVLNHTANESEWIQEHPEVTYNCYNCPYLRPAYLLDAALHQFSMDVKRGLYEDRGIPSEVCKEDHLNAIRYHFCTAVLEPLNIPELFICDVTKYVTDFLTAARTATPVSPDSRPNDELKLQQDPEFRRLAAKIDMHLALKLYNIYWNDTFDEESRLKKCAEEFKKKLDSLNANIIEEVKNHLNVAIENIIAGIRYYWVQADGPRFKEITIKCPLVYRYFTDCGTPKNLDEHERIMYSKNGRFLMAHNGWVMNSDPLKNFAAADSTVYVRRELIAWGDSVKLRFGDKPEDCPFLWDYMRKYVEQTARIFDGVRLDNCHSTPIPVAEYLLDCARRVRPDLYVVAELFTNSDMTDNIFVNRLGITSLIREAMSAWDSHEEGRLVYRYGGSPVGSFYQPSIRPLVPSIAHALFLDLTHDNPSPVEKRSVFDMLPSSALVSMACCASGSNRGYDELVPHHIHVVDETREYGEWTNDENLAAGNLRYVTAKTGIIRARKSINDLHFILGKEGFSQVYVDQMDRDIVAVTRHCPETHQSYILVAFTAFSHPDENSSTNQRGIKPLRFEGILDEIVIEATLNHFNLESQGSKFAKFEKFVKDSRWINGLSEYYVTMKEHIQVNDSDVFEQVDSETANVTQLNFKNFKPGSIVVVKVSLPKPVQNAIKTVRNLIDTFSLKKPTSLNTIISKMSLSDLNRALYRCGQEERDEGYGFDTYNIPNFGSMVYAGLQGFMSLLAKIRPNNDLGHPMCANLRDGNWMIDYVWKRLKLDKGTKELGEWIEENTKAFENIPRYLVPCYFDLVITGIYVLLLEQSYKLMSSFVEHGSTFVKGLSMGSMQFGAYIKSANLPTLSPNLAPPKPPMRENEKGELEQASVTLSAGLPHFSVGYMRNWGRDTFIALRGLFILTGRYQETREMILGYGACLRHGLIPNLLDGGRNSRYNCRDAVWWWLYCIKEYVEEAPNGISILSDKVSRLYPEDDSTAQLPGAVDQPLYDVMQDALRVHFQGLVFRERNAGRQIDEQMTDQGFNNQIGIHPETGFVFGGNRWNCGTWMDKMGSSEKAGNKGKPATPRDGSAVELVGLLKCVVSWLAKLNLENKYPYSGVERKHKNGNITQWTFQEWSDKIQANFEKYFWVNSQPVNGELRPDLINKRGIYKDSYGSSYEYTDFQLRSNFPIAMVAAPELFTAQNAWTALTQAEKYLLGPLGMKTLDPEDWAYRGDYDNSNDSSDPSVANGFNYHQGPEWLWPIGYFLRAKLQFAAQNGALHETLASTKLVLARHFTELQTSDWRGLPELTNNNGSYCKDSSRTQAWSMACVLEVLYDLQKIESSKSIIN